MDARTEADAERAPARVLLVDGELYHVCRHSTAATFRDLNRRRAALGLVPVRPSSSLLPTAREARAHAAAEIRAWRRQHALSVLPTGRAAPRWRSR
jgi:hypothetical protein